MIVELPFESLCSLQTIQLNLSQTTGISGGPHAWLTELACGLIKTQLYLYEFLKEQPHFFCGIKTGHWSRQPAKIGAVDRWELHFCTACLHALFICLDMYAMQERGQKQHTTMSGRLMGIIRI